MRSHTTFINGAVPQTEKPNSMTLEIILSIVVFATSVLSLDIDLKYALVAFVGASAGSVVLGYFKPETNRRAQFIKAMMSTISGIICGAAFARHYHLQEWEYLAMAFFLHALVSLILLKALVSFLDKDGGTLVQTVIVRMFGVDKSQITINNQPKIEAVEENK